MKDEDSEGDPMCAPTKCNICGKTTWAGCGNHIETVKSRVPADQWCGHELAKPQGNMISALFRR